MEILKSKNYEEFRLIEINRVLIPNKVTNLKQRMLEDGRQIIPIVCNSNMEIIDGQHRFQALKELNWEVMYYIDDNINSKDIISMNNSQTRWSQKDYVHFYASLENETYQKIEQIIREYPQFPLRVILFAIDGMAYVKEADVKDGKIMYSDASFAQARKCLDFLEIIETHLNERKIKIVNPSIFFFLVAKCYYLDGIDLGKLEKNIKYRYGLDNYGNSKQCADCLEKWYNYNVRTDYRYIATEIMPRRKK